MTLPPLANLFAIYDPNSPRSASRFRTLLTTRAFTRVSQPTSRWTVALTPVPGGHGAAPPEALPLYFVEGEDLLSTRTGDLCRAVDHAPEALARFPGDFGFLRIRQDETALVVRSAGGLAPFYVVRLGDVLAVSTRLGDLVQHVPLDPVLDPLINAIWAAGWPLFPEGRTFLAGVRILSRGCFAHLRPDRPIATAPYWNPRPAQFPPATASHAVEHASRLRQLLVEKLERDLDPEGRNLLTLSGGVDSSCLAALAAGVVRRRFSTWSLLPAPDALFAREMSYIDPLLHACKVERSWTVRLTGPVQLALLHAAPPVVFYVLHQALCALPGVLEEMDVRVLFGGEFADEVCGSAFTLPDWTSATTLPVLLGARRALPLGNRTLLRWAKHRLLGIARRPAMPFPSRLPGFVRDEVQEEYRAWAAARRRAAGAEPPAYRHCALRSEMDGFVAMNWEAATALGVRRSFPFFNRQILELAYECHPAELIGPGTKKPLRTALANDVPHHNLHRLDKGHWGAYTRNLHVDIETPLPPALASVIRPDWHPLPPAQLDFATACSLTALTRFARSLDLHSRPRRVA